MTTEFAAPSTGRLVELIAGMAGQPVPMLVDLVVDRFISGTPRRISREAPVLILDHDDTSITPGGGANAVYNVAALGGRPLPVGLIGDDPEGAGLKRIFEEACIDIGGILTRPGYQTPTKTRILGGPPHAIKQQIVRYDIGEKLALTDHEREALLRSLSAAADRPKVAVLSDYGYGAVEPEALPGLRQALGDSCLILGDSRYRLGELRGLDGATPNAEEAEAFLDDGNGSVEALEHSGLGLLSRLGARFVLVTLGNDGMSLCASAGVAHLPVHGTGEVADVTGAGDTVIGTFALAVAAGASPLEAACLANYAGGVVVMKMGTETVSPAELRQAVESDSELLGKIRWSPAGG
ncbi:MAG: hypothetical protein GY719_03450 [bacterium]|nr:hypothetical protein [bacterium]